MDAFVKQYRDLTILSQDIFSVNPMAILETDVTATVACLRDDTIRGNSHRKDERYTLKKTPTGWKIMNVRSRPMAAFAVK